MPLLPKHQIERASLRDQALTLLREALVTGQLVDGIVYSAKTMAEELGVSNGPIREALLALVDDDLLEPVPNKGYRTVPITPADMAEIYEMRALLEVAAVGKLADSGLPAALHNQLEHLVDQIEATAHDHDVAGNLNADRDFHLLILRAAGNQRLAKTVERLRDQTRLFNLRQLADTGDLVGSAAEHRTLLAALASRDRATAERVMQEHLNHIRGDWSAPET